MLFYHILILTLCILVCCGKSQIYFIVLHLVSSILNIRSLLFFFIFYIGVHLIYNVVLVSGVQQSDSVIHLHIFILFQIIFPYRLLQSTE